MADRGRKGKNKFDSALRLRDGPGGPKTDRRQSSEQEEEYKATSLRPPYVNSLPCTYPCYFCANCAHLNQEWDGQRLVQTPCPHSRYAVFVATDHPNHSAVCLAQHPSSTSTPEQLSQYDSLSTLQHQQSSPPRSEHGTQDASARARNEDLVKASAEGDTKRVVNLVRLGTDVNYHNEKGLTALHYASFDGHDDTVRRLIQIGADVNAHSHVFGTPISLAAVARRLSMVRMLLNYGAGSNIASLELGTPLHAACLGGDLDVAVELLHSAAEPDVYCEFNTRFARKLREPRSQGIDEVFRLSRAENSRIERVRCCPLYLAALAGRISLVTVLLDKGVRVNAPPSALIGAVKSGHDDVVELLLARGANLEIQDEDGRTALHVAAIDKGKSMMQLVLRSHPHVNVSASNGQTPLMVAAAGANLNAVKLLIQHGAETGVRDSHDWTVLHWAATDRGSSSIQCVLGAGPNVDARASDGRTPLMVAALYGNLECLELLLQHRADVKVRDAQGWTALHWAAMAESSSLVQSIRRAGGNVDVRASDGETPLMVAARLGNLENVKFLLKEGADERLVDQRGFTVSAIALENDKTEVANLLMPMTPDESAKSESTRVFSSHVFTRTGTSATSMSFPDTNRKEEAVDTPDRRLTIRSQISLETLNLEEADEQHLIAIFVQELWQSMHVRLGQFPGVTAGNETLSLLLLSYSNILKQTVQASTRFERGAVDFVRSRRKKIARKFENFRKAESDDSEEESTSVPDPNNPSSNAKVTSWLEHAHNTAQLLEDISEPVEENSATEQIADLVRAIPQMRHFLVDNDAWKWLSTQLNRICLGIQTPARDILAGFEEIGISRGGQSTRVCFEIDWQPRDFLHEQYPADMQPELHNVITIVRYDDRVQAVLCGEYIQSTWPTIGPPVLLAIERFICTDSIEQVQLPHGASVMIGIQDKRLNVDATGFPEILADIGELLAWLGAACRASPLDDEDCYCIVRSRVTRPDSGLNGDESLRCEVEYNFHEVNVGEKAGHECWRLLFRNVSIADGFMVPARSNDEAGLEISLPLMVALGDTPWADTLNNNFMLKGFSSMFYPVKQLEGSILWHFQRHMDSEFMPYALARSSCIKRDLVTGADVAWLYQQRHFVGWTAQAEVHLGTENFDYSKLEEPDADFVKNKMVLEKATISGGYFLNIGTTFGRGQHQAPLQARIADDYLACLNYVSRFNVVLYDTGAKRAWLVDGPSALLHITCCQLRSKDFVESLNLSSTTLAKYKAIDQSPLAVLRDRKNRMSVIRCEEDEADESVQTDQGAGKASSYTISQISVGGQARVHYGNADHSVTNNYNFASSSSSRLWRFQDLVASNCNYLIKAQEHEMTPPSGVDIRFTDRDRLEGWSFLDVVEQTAFMKPRIVYLQPSGRGWSNYTRALLAVTLMGDGFGELMTPGQSEQICQRWSIVPRGQDYLCTTVHRLRQNSKKNVAKKSDFPSFIADGVRWHQPNQLFEQCHCSKQKCNPIQVILPKLAWRTKQPKIPIDKYETAAVIFGQNERFRIWFPKDAHRDPEMDVDGLKAEKEAARDVRQTVVDDFDDALQVPHMGGSGNASRSDATLSHPLSSVTTRDDDSLTPPTSVEPFESFIPATLDQAGGPTNATTSSADLDTGTSSAAQGSQPRSARPWNRLTSRFGKKNIRK